MPETVRRPCPACATEEMRVSALGAIEIDLCPKCHGAWFDGGELTAAVEGPRVARLLATARGGVSRCWSCRTETSAAACPACGAGQLACPECGRNGLVAIEEAGVEVDVCNPCGGFWFDGQEFEAVAGRPLADIARAANPRATAAAVQDNRIDCSLCDRRIRRAHAFREGEDLYCGSCAPPGSSMLEVDLSAMRRNDSSSHADEYYDDNIQDLGGLLRTVFGWFTTRY